MLVLNLVSRLYQMYNNVKINKTAQAELYVNSSSLKVSRLIFVSCCVRGTYCSRHFNFAV